MDFKRALPWLLLPFALTGFCLLSVHPSPLFYPVFWQTLAASMSPGYLLALGLALLGILYLVGPRRRP